MPASLMVDHGWFGGIRGVSGRAAWFLSEEGGGCAPGKWGLYA